MVERDELLDRIEALKERERTAYERGIKDGAQVGFERGQQHERRKILDALPPVDHEPAGNGSADEASEAADAAPAEGEEYAWQRALAWLREQGQDGATNGQAVAAARAAGTWSASQLNVLKTRGVAVNRDGLWYAVEAS